MIRRWSRLNQFDQIVKKNSFALIRFKMFKLLRAMNFRRFNLGFSKFKRRKLASFKRRANWLIYSQIIKFWIKDYVFSKRLIRSQFIFGIFFFNYQIFNYNYTKKRTPFSVMLQTNFLLATSVKLFFLYFSKLFSNFCFNNHFSIYKNFNFILMFSDEMYDEKNQESENNNVLLLSEKYDFLLYNDNLNLDYKNLKLIDFFLFYNFKYKYFLKIYENFVFFFINQLFNSNVK